VLPRNAEQESLGFGKEQFQAAGAIHPGVTNREQEISFRE
jgi:hypothetical protein